MSQICENIQKVNNRIEHACSKAGRDPGEVHLIAISKTKPLSDIEEAFNCGQVHFGENRAKDF